MKTLRSNLMGTVFALVAVVMAVAVWMLPAPAGEVMRTAPVAPQSAPAPAPLDLAMLTARPAFDRSRRPLVVKETPAPAQPAPAPVTVSLHGVIGNADGGLTALLRMSNTPELLTRRIGEDIGGLKLESIKAKQALLRDGAGNAHVLLLVTE